MENWEWVLLIIGGFVLAVLLQDYLGYMEKIPVSYVIYFIIVLAFWETENMFRIFRLKSSKLVATNFDTTTDGAYIPAGDYAIFTMGDIDYWFHFKGKKGAIICPRDAINKLGRHVVLTINPRPVQLNELPYPVITKLKEYGIEPPYYIGQTSERQELVEPDVTRLQQEVQELNSLLNMIRETAKGKFDTVANVIEFMKRIQEEMKEESWIKKALGLGKEEKSKDGEE